MRLLVLSDIHGNYEALKSLLPYIKEVDKVLCLGDIVGYGCAVNECIDLARTYNFVCIRGNHEQYVIEGTDNQPKYLNESVLWGIQYAKKVITQEHLKWLNSLPLTMGGRFDGLSILMAHGSPFDPINGYVYENNTDFSLWESFQFDYLFIGHTHRTLSHQLGTGGLILNPGSVGQARDFEGKSCAAILDTQTRVVKCLRVDYDYQKHLDLSISHGAGEWVYKHYRTLLSK